MDLSGILSADIRRIDEAGNIKAVVTLRLVGGGTWTTDFYVDADDVTAFKTGTNPQKAAIRKKYIRQAAVNFLRETSPPAPVDQGTMNVLKTAFSDAGDT